MLDVATTIAILIAVGLGAGTLGSMLGVGGGIIMVPALAFMGLPPAQIASTSLFAVTSTSVSSTVAYSRQKRIDYRVGIEMAASAIPGAVIGALISSQITA
ncbi:MAG: sulfite exporter TauE/SafE family protein, partial [Nitrososphaera sp.]